MLQVGEQLTTLALGSVPVLIGGETGSGKSWAARYLHDISDRSGNPFVEVNCAGLTATFLDSELFGHERGAYTDAKTQKLGLFEIADGGTVFLDEIGDLTPELQPKLLRVLETQRFRRLGGTREIQVNVRLVAATHRDLSIAVTEGRFRADLYYRLAVYPVRLPSLRERGAEDISMLSCRLLTDAHRRLGRGPVKFSAEALDVLTRYEWPGNIRELRNMVERLLLVAIHSDQIEVAHLPPDLRAAVPQALSQRHVDCGDETFLSLAEAERRHIDHVLARCGNNRTRAASVLGISRTTLYENLSQRKARK